jgi:hypothetical protein
MNRISWTLGGGQESRILPFPTTVLLLWLLLLFFLFKNQNSSNGIFDFILFCRGFTPGVGVTANTLTPFLLNLSRVKEDWGRSGDVVYQQTP